MPCENIAGELYCKVVRNRTHRTLVMTIEKNYFCPFQNPKRMVERVLKRLPDEISENETLEDLKTGRQSLECTHTYL